MTDDLKDLFLSKDIEDIDLAFTIARKLDIPIMQVDLLFGDVHSHIGGENAIDLWNKYFNSFIEPTKWKKEE